MRADLPHTAVLIGRFQPPHRAHLALMQQALEQARELVVVLGSANHAPTPKNPLSDHARARLIVQMLLETGVDARRIRIAEVPDYFYNLELWVAQVQRAVGTGRAILCGFEKDASSFYLKLFPEWQALAPRLSSAPWSGLSATPIREAMYGGDWQSVESAVPRSVFGALLTFSKTPDFEDLLADREAIRQLAAHGPIRDEAAGLVSQGSVLLQTRTQRPGLGLWSLPPTDTLTFQLPPARRERWLDHPDRLPGVDWKTLARLYELPHPFDPPPGTAWISVDALQNQPERFFADHAQGIRALLEAW